MTRCNPDQCENNDEQKEDAEIWMAGPPQLGGIDVLSKLAPLCCDETVSGARGAAAKPAAVVVPAQFSGFEITIDLPWGGLELVGHAERVYAAAMEGISFW